MERSPRLSRLREPLWDMWLRRPKVTGRQAVSLACNVDPDAVHREMQRLSSGTGRSILDETPIYKWLSQYQNALDSYDPALGEPPAAPRQMKDLVSLELFARWAVETADAIPGWAVPEKMRSFVSELGASPKGARSAKWPWGNHTSRNLELLEVAANEFWARWDGSARNAPTNESVIQWLTQKKGASRSLAESIASILRPATEVLPTGNRPAKKRKG
jgi:hypothetical protein